MERLAGTGIAGLDDVLAGGFVRGRAYLVEGKPGAGKTTLAMQFLMAGAAAGETSLLLSLAESQEEIGEASASHGWSLDGVTIRHVMPADHTLEEDRRQTLLHAADLELGEVIEEIFGIIRSLRPQRVVLDSLSEIRLLAQNPLRYRRQLLTLKSVIAQGGATVLLLDDLTIEPTEQTAHSLAHGVLRLEDTPLDYGVGRRRLRVVKYRGRAYRAGFHDLVIGRGGVSVFPRLVAAERRESFEREPRSTGSASFDALLGGGLEPGTSTILLGPSGCGKTLLALGPLLAAARRGERSAMFAFDEDVALLRARVATMHPDMAELERSGLFQLHQLDAAELPPGEFAHRIRHLVEHDAVRALLIDSLNGYRSAMPGEAHLVLHMHELLTYLNQTGCTTLLTVVQHGLIGEMGTSVDLTYLSDSVILLRYFEAAGRIRRAISVMKKRASGHETSIRELTISSAGVVVGEPLAQFQGVLTGVPVFVGDTARLDGGA